MGGLLVGLVEPTVVMHTNRDRGIAFSVVLVTEKTRGNEWRIDAAVRHAGE